MKCGVTAVNRAQVSGNVFQIVSCGGVLRGFAVGCFDCNIGSGVNQHLNDFQLAVSRDGFCRTVNQRRAVGGRTRVAIGARLHQKAHAFGFARAGGQHQRRQAVGRFRFDIRARFKQILQDVVVTVQSRKRQR